MNDLKLNALSLAFVISSLSKLSDSGDTYRVSVKKWREKRSLSQNSLYWKWMDEINKQAPLTCDSKVSGPEMWHEVFKKYYCPLKAISNERASIEIKSTKMLDKGEMVFYLNKIESWCFDRGIKLTIPEDSVYASLMNEQNY